MNEGRISMKLTFAYDVVIEHLEGTEQYFHNYFDYTVWQRYLSVFDTIEVISRQKEVDSGSRQNLKVSSGPEVTFLKAPSLSDPVSMITKRKEVIEIIKKSLSTTDAMIVRLPSEIGPLAVEVAKSIGKPYAVEVVGHAWDALWNYGNWKGKVYAPIMTWKMKKTVKNAPFALYVTREFLQKHYPTKGHSINCSNVELPSLPKSILEDRKVVMDGNNDTIKIGLIGSMVSKYKGIDIALQGLHLIKDEISFEFRVIGEGNPTEWDELSRNLGIRNKVKFYSPVPSGEPIFKWLDDLDLYIQPSFQEGLPRALIEAMSRALPAIGSDVGGIPELLSPDCVFKAGNAEELASILLRMVRDRQKREKESEKNFKTALEYTNLILNERRTTFWGEFSQFAESFKKVM